MGDWQNVEYEIGFVYRPYVWAFEGDNNAHVVAWQSLRSWKALTTYGEMQYTSLTSYSIAVQQLKRQQQLSQMGWWQSFGHGLMQGVGSMYRR